MFLNPVVFVHGNDDDHVGRRFIRVPSLQSQPKSLACSFCVQVALSKLVADLASSKFFP